MFLLLSFMICTKWTVLFELPQIRQFVVWSNAKNNQCCVHNGQFPIQNEPSLCTGLWPLMIVSTKNHHKRLVILRVKSNSWFLFSKVFFSLQSSELFYLNLFRKLPFMSRGIFAFYEVNRTPRIFWSELKIFYKYRWG